MKGLKHFVVALALLMVGMQAQATVWSPTSRDVQTITFNGFGANFAIFDADTLFAGSALTLNEPGDSIRITNVAGNYIFTNDAGSFINLGASDSFVIGANLGAGYIIDSAISLLSTNSFKLTFTGPPGASIELFAIDVAPVPEPTTFLLMALALAGLVVYRRRVRV